jgi:hypothetical protein
MHILINIMVDELSLCLCVTLSNQKLFKILSICILAIIFQQFFFTHSSPSLYLFIFFLFVRKNYNYQLKFNCK